MALDSADCTGPQHCIAVGSIGKRQSQAAVLSSSDGGLSWRSLPALRGAGVLTEVTCSTATRCVAVGTPEAARGLPITGTAQPLIYETEDAGRAWVRATLPVPPHSAEPGLFSSAQVACSGASCMAVLNASNLLAPTVSSFLISSDHGRTWALDRSPRALGSVAWSANINSLACDEYQVCVAVGAGDDGGAIFYSHDGGRTWAEAHGLRGGPPWA